MNFYTVENKKKSIFKTFMIYFACMVVFCIIRIIGTTSLIPEGRVGDIIFSVVVQGVVLFALPLFLYCVLLNVKPKAVFKTCNFNKTNYKVILVSIGLGILCFIINIAVSSLFNGILTFTGYRFPTGSGGDDYSTINFFIDLILVAVLPAICEEFLHRGIVLQGIKHAGFKNAILISSILFALLHFNIQQTAYAFVIGLIMGFVSVVAKNIYPAIIIHFMNNAISTYLSYASANNWWLGDSLNELQSMLLANDPVWVFIITAICMIIVVSLLCLFIWLLYKQSILRSVNKAIDKVYNSNIVADDDRVVLSGTRVIHELLENHTLLNLDYKKMDNPINMVLPKEKTRFLCRPKDKIFMWSAMFLGAIVTVFTYIWGLL